MGTGENSSKINEALNNTLNDLLKFPLMEAIAGRRSRRFCLGAEIPDGVLAFKSKHKPLPLSEIEQQLVLSAMGGVTGWNFAIMRHQRANAAPYTEEFKECVALQAQYIYDTYGRFPATVQSIFSFLYLQAHHLDLDFYDHYFKPGAYLTTHREHMKKWH